MLNEFRRPIPLVLALLALILLIMLITVWTQQNRQQAEFETQLAAVEEAGRTQLAARDAEVEQQVAELAAEREALLAERDELAMALQEQQATTGQLEEVQQQIESRAGGAERARRAT
jgi:uncharacterized protein HemX